jgi:hypothetical protein
MSRLLTLWPFTHDRASRHEGLSDPNRVAAGEAGGDFQLAADRLDVSAEGGEVDIVFVLDAGDVRLGDVERLGDLPLGELPPGSKVRQPNALQLARLQLAARSRKAAR